MEAHKSKTSKILLLSLCLMVFAIGKSLACNKSGFPHPVVCQVWGCNGDNGKGGSCTVGTPIDGGVTALLLGGGILVWGIRRRKRNSN